MFFIYSSGAPQVYSATTKSFRSVTPALLPISVKPTPDTSHLSTTSIAPMVNNLEPSTVFTGTNAILNVTSPNSNTTPAASSSQSSTAEPIPKPSSSTVAGAATEKKKKKKKKKQEGQEKKPRKALRSAGGQVWEDPTLQDWDQSKLFMLLILCSFDFYTKFTSDYDRFNVGIQNQMEVWK